MTQRIQTLLVANRGEIARRVIRTAKALGIRTVAIFSDADRELPHVHEADSAIHVGAAASIESYLRIDRLIEAAQQSKADAIHPGYGFLAENPELAAACEKNGIIFVGPPSQVIRAMGSKLQAKKIMQAAGVPVIPGYDGKAQELSALEREAKKLGFPLLIKASAGGGGKGMKLVTDARELNDALSSARRQAENAFGDGTLILEKYLAGARHVEVQILADSQANCLHVWERDCSAQRRHQKIIEEAPAPELSNAQRQAILHAAVRCAQAIDYRSAGTVEFVLAPGGEFYFLEVNTRIQVEHPVSELITGIDIVEEQIRVAQGQALSFEQDDLIAQGHAIEARLYAEDARAGFLPQSGQITDWHMPELEGVRTEESYAAGNLVDIHYDPMLAKIIAWGEDREAATRRLRYALQQTSVLGITTNRSFLLQILDHQDFGSARHTTDWVEDLVAKNAPQIDEQDIETAALVATLARFCERATSASTLLSIPPGWRNNPHSWQWETFALGEKDLRVEYQSIDRQRLNMRCASIEAELRIINWQKPLLRFEHKGMVQEARITWDQDRCDVHFPDVDVALEIEQRFLDPLHSKQHGAGCIAPMPGKVVRVCVNEGDAVQQGQELIVIEAMKMEQTLLASAAGRASRVHVAVGQQVQAHELLVQLDSSDA